MTDDDDAPLYPLLGYTAGVVEGVVALRFDFATCKADYASGEGESQQFVMTPEAAIEIGKALQERGALALGGAN
jgi:hypothetical protein